MTLHQTGEANNLKQKERSDQIRNRLIFGLTKKDSEKQTENGSPLNRGCQHPKGQREKFSPIVQRLRLTFHSTSRAS